MTDPVSRAALPWTDLWLLDACRRLGHTRFERADLPESPSAWEAVVAAGVPGERVLETACVVANAEPAALGAGDSDELAALLACSVARRYGVVPLRTEGSVLLVACSNPLHPTLPEDLAFAAGHRIRLQVAAPAAIRAEQARIYPELGPKLASAVPHTSTRGSGGPDSVALLDRVLGEALRQRASDIHMEPGAHGLLVRLRVDGVLYDQLEIPREHAGPLVSRLKVLANLDIADRIRPQDGRTSIDITSLHELLDNVAAPILESEERSSRDVVDALLSRLLPEAHTAPTPRAITPAAGAAGERVLIVEEDRAARRELRAALEREGFGVLEATDGEAALAYARRLHPNRVVCELALPRLDGIGLLQALAQLPTAPPVLVYTDQRDAALLDWACEVGAAGVASKAEGAGAVLQWLRSAARAAA